MQSASTLIQLTVYTAVKCRRLLSQRVTILLIYFQIILSTQINKCDCPMNRTEKKKIYQKANSLSRFHDCSLSNTNGFFHCNSRKKNNSGQFRVSH